MHQRVAIVRATSSATAGRLWMCRRGGQAAHQLRRGEKRSRCTPSGARIDPEVPDQQ